MPTNKLVRHLLQTAIALTLTLGLARADVGYTVTTLAGAASAGHDDGTGTEARFNTPGGVAVDSHGNVYVADTDNNLIRKITPGGVVSTFAGSHLEAGSTNGTGSAARFDAPYGVAVDRADNVYVADINNSAIRKITPAQVVTTFATGLAVPTSLAFDTSGNLYVTETGTHSVLKITPAGSSSVFAGPSNFVSPRGIAVDANGYVYVSDFLDYTIRKITPQGVVSTFSGLTAVAGDADGASSRYRFPQGIAVDGAGYVYVADNGGHRIRRLDASGHATTIAGPVPPTSVASGFINGAGSDARFNAPEGLAVDGAGAVYVADTANNSIRKVARATVLTISQQPQGASVVANAPASFSVTVTGGSTLSYQWRKNGANIVGATASTYTISNTVVSDTGDYSVVTFNEDGIVTSNVATLVVQPAAAVDFNGDSKTDLLWQNTTTGERYVWLMDGSTYTSSVNLGTVATQWSIAAGADFNADGKTDILWQNTSTGERYLWLMDGSTYLSSVNLGTVATPWSIAAAADFNTDGKTDILWQNTATGERYLWIMDGATYISSVNLGTIAVQWSIVAAADFNADGKNDIVWENTSTGERYVWFMDGATYTGSASLGTASLQWSIAAAADFNSDGKTDLLWQNTTTGQRYLWYMDGAAFSSSATPGIVPVEWSIAN